MLKVKNQHYIPQFYMNRFSTNGKIDVYCVDNKKLLKNQSPRNFASRRYFYDIDKTEIKDYLRETIEYLNNTKRTIDNKILEDEQIVEHHLANVECATQEVFDKLEKDQSILKNDDIRACICNFLHLLAYRTESYRLDEENFYKTIYDRAKQIYPNLPEECYYDLSPERAREKQINKLLSIKQSLRTGLMLINNYNWYIGINTSDKINFIISDNPALYISQGFNDICVPISKKYALIFQIKNKNAPIFIKDKHHKNRMYLSEKSVLIYNELQISCARRYIFGDKINIELAKNIFDIVKKD